MAIAKTKSLTGLYVVSEFGDLFHVIEQDFDHTMFWLCDKIAPKGTSRTLAHEGLLRDSKECVDGTLPPVLKTRRAAKTKALAPCAPDSGDCFD